MRRVTDGEAHRLLAQAVEFATREVLRAEVERSDPEYGGMGRVDWREEAHDAIGNAFLGEIGGDQDLAWRAVRAMEADIARLGEFWVGDWPRLAREAFEGLISAAIEEGILEDRQGRQGS